MTEIKPCFNPNCDLSQPVLVRGGVLKDVYWVSCRGCGISGSRAVSKEIAITAWDKIAVMKEMLENIKKVDTGYYKQIAHGMEHDPKVLKMELLDLINEIEQSLKGE